MYMVTDRNEEVLYPCIRIYENLSDAIFAMRETVSKAEKEGFGHENFSFYTDSDYLFSVYLVKVKNKKKYTYTCSILEIKDGTRVFV